MQSAPKPVRPKPVPKRWRDFLSSDRSSQQSQSESGIHLPHDDDEDADYSDESTSLGKLNNKIKIQFKKKLQFFGT